ncbi:MAG: hypothetical protein U1E47_00645 [Rivihabitans pingtungensis]
MAVRDMDVAAEVIGILYPENQTAGLCHQLAHRGTAGALWAFVLLGTVDPGKLSTCTACFRCCS